jgi:hypothetical protein
MSDPFAKLRGLPIDRLEDVFVVAMDDAITGTTQTLKSIYEKRKALFQRAMHIMDEMKAPLKEKMLAQGLVMGSKMHIIWYTEAEGHKKGTTVKISIRSSSWEYTMGGEMRWSVLGAVRSNSNGLIIKASSYTEELDSIIKELYALDKEQNSLYTLLGKVKEFRSADKHKYIASKIRVSGNKLITDEIIEEIRRAITAG